MFMIHNKGNYIGIDANNRATVVTSKNKAKMFEKESAAINFLDNLRTTLKRFEWHITFDKDGIVKEENQDADLIDSTEENIYVQSLIEKEDIDICEFLIKTIETISDLEKYKENMLYNEQLWDDKILDVRHYMRDNRTKLNAIQLQNLAKFGMKLEKERYQFKSNRIICTIILNDFSRLADTGTINKIKKVKESEYKPKVLSFEDIDKIVGKK